MFSKIRGQQPEVSKSHTEKQQGAELNCMQYLSDNIFQSASSFREDTLKAWSIIN